MVNYWMIIGRAATSARVRESLHKALPPRPYRIDSTRGEFKFTRNEYQQARDAVRQGLEGAGVKVVPMSLIELGELLYASCYEEVHESLGFLAGIMAKYGVGAERSDLFHSALGAALLDQEAARMFLAGQFKEAMFDHLTLDEQTALQKVLADCELQKHTEEMRLACWWPGCLDKAFDLASFFMPAPIQVIPGMVVNHKPKYIKGGS